MQKLDERGRLEALAAFAERLADKEASFGSMSGAEDPGTTNDPVQIPFWKSSDLADAFVKMAYDTNWVLGDFDWPKWLDSEEANSLLKDQLAIAKASPDQLHKLMTALIRSDRFCEGTVLQAFTEGTLQAIAWRAAGLLN